MPVAGCEVRCHLLEASVELSPEPHLGWVRRWNILTLIFVGSGGVLDSFKVTQLIDSRVRIWTQVCLIPNTCLCHKPTHRVRA